MKPIIGVTGYLHPYTAQVSGVFVGEGYTNAVSQAGGIPLVVPYLETEEEVRELAARLDGLLLTGGFDMDPLYFGEQPLPELGAVTPERDWIETILFEEMQKQGKPVLGICRGEQVINVLLGGTLYQDLPSQKQDGLLNHDQKAPRWYGTHDVKVLPGTLVYEAFGSEKIRTNSFHHQAVKDVAPGLIASAWAEDGIIEAIERPAGEGPYLVAVQWHPENMWRKEPVVLRLFAGFVEAASK